MEAWNFQNGRKFIKITNPVIYMFRYIYFTSFIGAIMATRIMAADILSNTSAMHEVSGGRTNNLEAKFLIEKYGNSWTIEIDLTAQTNFSQNSWLKITNQSGSMLRLWLTNGTEVFPQNPSVLATGLLPAQTTVTDIMRGVYPRSVRSLQWWQTGFSGCTAGETSPLSSFSLQNQFDTSFTNDVVLEIAPLIYRVDADGVTAHLLQFPSTKVKLLANGDVHKEE